MQNTTHSQSLAGFPPRYSSGSDFYPSADPLPDVPIMPSTRLQLELLLQEPVLDLRAVSEVILEDIGATVQILRLVGEEYAVEEDRPIRIEDCIASLNAEIWFRAVCASTLIQNSKVLDAWQHAKRIGYYAEQLAEQEEGLRPGEGHLIGLLHEVGRLPELLGWKNPAEAALDGEDSTQSVGAMLAEHWHLPSCVVAATREQEQEELTVFGSLLKAAHACLQQEDAGANAYAGLGSISLVDSFANSLAEAGSAAMGSPLVSFA